MTPPAPLPVEDGIFELPGPAPLWIWAHTCPTPDCACREAFILASQDRATLVERAAASAEAVRAGDGYAAIAARCEGVDVFQIDLDTMEASAPGTDAPAAPRTRAVLDRIDGELLDQLGRLWFRGKGRVEPGARARAAEQIAVRNWSPGDMLAYQEVLGGLREDLYSLAGRLYRVEDLYCTVPGCTCGDVSLDVEAVASRGGQHLGRVVVARSGATKLEPRGTGAERLAQVWAAFQARHPRYRERLARREAEMKEIGARVVPDTSPQRAQAAPKVGRNDPCPCGSGKKHKKCCGAA